MGRGLCSLLRRGLYHTGTEAGLTEKAFSLERREVGFGVS